MGCFFKISSENLESFTLLTHPDVQFISSSNGITGTLSLEPDPSKDLKQIIIDTIDSTGFVTTDYSLQDAISDAVGVIRTDLGNGITISNVESYMKEYMKIVNSRPQISRNLRRFNIKRTEQSGSLGRDTYEKTVIVNNLMKKHRYESTLYDFSYVNYHTLNFFTSSEVPSNSAIIYPNMTSAFGSTFGPYSPTPEPGDGFSLGFYINPRYTNDNKAPFKAGTIMHLSSTYAVSLVTGSRKDPSGLSEGFRIMLQMSHSADIAPSKITLTSSKNDVRDRQYPYDLIFLSDDNSLLRNRWNHVTIRWGSKAINNGSGSITIEKEDYHFNVPSASSMLKILPNSLSSNSPDALVIGNFYEGTNKGDNAQAAFFNSTAALSEGTVTTPGHSSDPVSYRFDHPLNAEIHDLKIYNKYIDSTTVYSSSLNGPENFDESSILFYVPPFFVKEGPSRNILATLDEVRFKGTENPFNAELAFRSADCFAINLQNFTREFVTGSYPRHLNLTASVNLFPRAGTIPGPETLNRTGSLRKGNLTVLPNDNGKFTPNFNLLLSGNDVSRPAPESPMSKFVNFNGVQDLTLIDLKKAVTGSATYFRNFVTRDPAFFKTLAADIDGAPDFYIVYQNLGGDRSSYFNSWLNISNLYYGESISRGSFTFLDGNLTGSGNKISMMLKDDKKGGLYRADCLTDHATWNSVGNIFYNEGIIFIKSPNIHFIGKDQFEVNFKGHHSTPIFTANIPCEANHFNSSSNPAFKLVSSSLDANEAGGEFVYITGINLHDNNLNIIMKATLAQPVVKRMTDRFLFRVRMDY